VNFGLRLEVVPFGRGVVAKHRNRVDIIADVLDVAAHGAKKTRIMYIANLSYRLLEKYLNETISIGFMQFNENGYEVTEKGRSFLEHYVQFSRKYSDLEGKLEDMRFEREVLDRMCRPPRSREPTLRALTRRKSR
jgi:predicted transcriptional regulator